MKIAEQLDRFWTSPQTEPRPLRCGPRPQVRQGFGPQRRYSGLGPGPKPSHKQKLKSALSENCNPCPWENLSPMFLNVHQKLNCIVPAKKISSE